MFSITTQRTLFMYQFEEFYQKLLYLCSKIKSTIFGSVPKHLCEYLNKSLYVT